MREPISRQLADALRRDLDAREGDATVSVWLPSSRLDLVSAQLSEIDLDFRTSASMLEGFERRDQGALYDMLRHGDELGWRLESSFRPLPAYFPFARGNAAPIRPDEGGLDVVSARQGASVDLVLEASGLILHLLQTFPNLFLMLPIAFRRANLQQTSPPSPREIEARRIKRRITHRFGNVESVIEEFD